jgi:hypothetical protein
MCTSDEALMKTEAAPFVHAPAGRSQALKARPAIPCASDAAASTASHPNVRDDRDTPLVEGCDSREMPLICRKKEAEYFFGEDWTGGIRLILLRK